MITFCIGLAILFFGYIFYSRYTEKQFQPDERQTPALKINDGVDFVPLKKWRNMLIQFLNIAGLGPILGALQGILFGPIAFIIIPAGCVLMGAVHDYFSGMISMRDNGMQITGLAQKYLGKNFYACLLVIICISLMLVTGVFVYTSGDLLASRFLNQTDFSITNPVIIAVYSVITLYYIIATLFPIDKIIGKVYPVFAAFLIIGTGMIFIGCICKGMVLTELDIHHLNLHPKHLAFIPMFFMTVSCGLLSGFHSTQSTIISRTVTSEYEGRQTFYGMMCLESLIAMIWAACAMTAYSQNIVPLEFIGKANAIDYISNAFLPYILTFIVTIAVVVLPITSGDTALRGLRLTLAEMLKFDQKLIANRLMITIPLLVILCALIVFIKSDSEAFFVMWRYFNFFNQLMVLPTLFMASILLFIKKRNYFMTLIPGLFFVFVTVTFICQNDIGFRLSLKCSKIIASVFVVLTIIWLFKRTKDVSNMKAEEEKQFRKAEQQELTKV